MLKVSMDELNGVLRDFNKLTDFLTVVYDADRKRIASYPQNMCAFCTEVRKSRVLANKCFECDNIGFDVCDKTKKPYIYECHMSVLEAVAPIYFNETNVGYLMFGQLLPKDHSKTFEKAERVSKQYGLELSKEMIEQMPIADDETIRAAVNMMTMCANYLYTNEIIRKSPDMLADRLKKYICENIAGDLSVDSVCKRFYISRTKLYQVSVSAFGLGFSDYVRSIKIKEAKKLLSSTDNPISRISELVGIKNTNYFIRLFKKCEGVTPLTYRKITSI